MKNESKITSGKKNSETNKNPEPNRKTIEQSPSHKEVKILLAVVAGILILLVGGSAFLNAQGSDGAREEAIEEALLNSKSKMLREYDPILVNAVKIHDYKETHQGREYSHIAVEITVPNLQDVYDYYFEEMIRQEVWDKEDTRESLQEIYRQAVEKAQKAVYPLEEELLLSEEERDYRVHNPEIFMMILPENLTEIIAEDFDRVMEIMNQPLEPEWERGTDMVFDEVMENLLEQEFFNEITFSWNRSREGTRYDLTATINEVSEIPHIGDFENFRPYREEIKDRESLVIIIERVLKEQVPMERNIRTLEIQEQSVSEDGEWGYKLSSRGGSSSYFRQTMANVQDFFQMSYLSFQNLETFYHTTFPRDKEPWPSPLHTADYEDQQVLTRMVVEGERRKLMLEGDALWYRVYDSKNLEVVEEILIDDEVSREDVMSEDLRPHYWNEIRSQKGYDLIVYGEGRKHMYRVERDREGLVKSKLTGDYGDFSREEYYELGGRLYHIGQHGPGKEQEMRELQIVDVEEDEVIYDRRQGDLNDGNNYLSGNIFANEKENLLLIHYRGNQELLGDTFGEENLKIYQGTEEGLKVHPLTEEIQKTGLIRHYQIMDESRVFIENYQNGQWVIDLREKSVIPVNQSVSAEAFLNAYKEEQVREAEENSEMLDYVFDIYEEPQYRFTFLGEDLFFVEGYFHSGGGSLVFQREIWEVTDRVSTKIKFTIEADEGTLQYAYQDGVMILTDEHRLMVIEPDREVLKNSSFEGDLSFKDLAGHRAFHLRDRYREPEKLRQESSYPIYGNQHFLNPFNQYRYDRETGNLFYISRGGGEDAYTHILLRDPEIEPLIPLWDYQELSIDQTFQTLYYRDHNGTRIYDVEAFVKSLIQVSQGE